MEDIAPKLYEQIKEEYDRKITNSERLSTLSKKLEKGAATYKEAHEFAIESGEILSQVFQNNLSSSVLPDGKLYYNIADRIIRPMMGDLYEGVADYSKEVQTLLNKKQKIGIKAIQSEINEDKIQGIINITSGKEHFDDIVYMLGEPIVNFAQTIVDDTVKVNADFQYKAGLSPKIIRTSTGKCCKWCDNLAGVYEYEEVSDTGNNVFRRHKYCKCLVEYDGGDGKRQNVHTKKWSKANESDKMKEKKTSGLSPDSDSIINGIKEEISKQNIKKIAKRQDIHRVDTQLYKERKNRLEEKGEYGPSYITVSDNEIISLVEKYSGTGIIKYNNRGEWSHQEIIVTNDKIIGVVVDNRNGNFAETPVFKIHYAKDGIHIVPDYPSKRR